MTERVRYLIRLFSFSRFIFYNDRKLIHHTPSFEGRNKNIVEIVTYIICHIIFITSHIIRRVSSRLICNSRIRVDAARNKMLTDKSYTVAKVNLSVAQERVKLQTANCTSALLLKARNSTWKQSRFQSYKSV